MESKEAREMSIYPMKRLLVLSFLFLTLVCPASPAVADAGGVPGIPGIDDCDSLVLRTSEGWWLRVYRDGSGSYGYGTDISHVDVEMGTFVFKEAYEETSNAAATGSKSAGGPYIAVSYYPPGIHSAREYYFIGGRKYTALLLRLARENGVSPANEFEEMSHKKIERHWENVPFIP
jgi:hypothetical protein